MCWITKNSSRIDNTPMIKIKIVFCTFLNFTFEKFLEVVFWMHAAEVVRRESWGNISVACHSISSKPLYWLSPIYDKKVYSGCIYAYYIVKCILYYIDVTYT